MRKQCILATYRLPQAHHGKYEEFFISKILRTVIIHLLLLFIQLSLLCHKIMLVCHTFSREGASYTGIYGLLVFNIMHNNIPVVCQVLFSQASWVKKSNVFKDIFTC